MCVVLIASATVSAAAPRSITMAIEDDNFYPWTMKDGSGIDSLLVRKAAENLGVHLDIVLFPWKRCLSALKNNSVDAVFPVSYKKDRLEMGAYPTTVGGALDLSRSLHSSSYSLYVRKNSGLSWDGETFINLHGKIGVPGGYSIIELLLEKGATVVEVNSTDQLMKMLAVGRLQGGATVTACGDYALKNDHKSAAQIRTVSPPLARKPYFLMFSHGFVKENKRLAEQLWDEITRIRRSELYERMYDNFMRDK